MKKLLSSGKVIFAQKLSTWTLSFTFAFIVTLEPLITAEGLAVVETNPGGVVSFAVISSGTCLDSFNDVSSDTVTVQDTVNDRFIYNTTSFSGFGIKEVTPTTPSVPSDGGGGGGCTYNWVCTDWSICTANSVQTRTCTNQGTCSGTTGKPIEIQTCVVEEVEEVEEIPTQLFDISLSLDDSIISNSNELSAVVTFESFGTEPTPVNLTFIIEDESGNEIYREEDSITVITEEVLRKSFEGLNLPRGDYTLVLETLYNVDVFDEFRQEFEISVEKKYVNLWIWIIGGIVAVLVIGLVLWLVIRKRKKRKMK